MLKQSVFVLASTMVLGFGLSKSAAAFVYDEAVDGDLAGGAASEIFDLDIGVNVISGRISFVNIPDISSDFDSFGFNIPTGTLLDSILLDIELLPIGSGSFNNANFGLQSGNVFIDSESVAIPSSNRELFESQLPLASGQYTLRTNSISGLLEFGDFRTAAYSFSLNVASETSSESVPEPISVFSILAFGATVAGLSLKKKQTA